MCVSVYVRWVWVPTEARGIRFLWSLSYNCEPPDIWLREHNLDTLEEQALLTT